MADTLEPMEVGAPVAQRLSRGGNQQTISVAILGAHYVGKSTLFNLLTGFSQRTSLWPETTVEIRRGAHRRGDAVFEIADLPSVYTLTATSPDEQVARECLLQENPDSEALLAKMIEDAARMGYLTAGQPGCVDARCSACSTRGACFASGSPPTWSLTEKGRRLLEGTPRP